MHMRNKPPMLVPPEYRDEIEQSSKAELMDLAWTFAEFFASYTTSKPLSGAALTEAALVAFRERRDRVRAQRNARSRARAAVAAAKAAREP